MENEEILQKLSNLEKKIDKLLNLNTKIAKALHLLPVSEKEERALQIQQRENLATAAKINHELNVMENKDSKPEPSLNLASLIPDDEVYTDVFGSDILGGTKYGN